MAFILTILFIPYYVIAIWTYTHPVESKLFGERWTFKKKPELTESAIFFRKFKSMCAIIIMSVILAAVYFSNAFINFILIITFIIYIGYQIYQYYKKFIE